MISLSLARNLVFFLRFHQHLAADGGDGCWNLDGFVSLINFSFNSSLKAHRHNLSSLVTKISIKPLFVHHIASIPGGTMRRSSLASSPHQYMPFFASNHCPKIYPPCKTEPIILFPPPPPPMAAPPSDDVPKTEFEVPEGWIFVTKPNRKGQLVKYYTNIMGQRFYSEADLMRNIIDSKKKGYAIYAPDFVPPTSGPFAMGRKSKVETDSSSNAKAASRNRGRREGSSSKSKGRTKPKKENEVESRDDVECATALLDLSVEDKNEVQSAMALLEISGQSDRRASRRLAGLEPELRNDFDFKRALEYVIKDKPRQ